MLCFMKRNTWMKCSVAFPSVGHSLCPILMKVQGLCNLCLGNMSLDHLEL